VIKASSGRQIGALVADLSASSSTIREAAVARLIVLGERAVARLTAVVADRSAPPAARLAALRAIDGIGDSRGADAALAAMGDHDPQIACTAVAVACAHLGGARSVAIVDGLTAAALDRARPQPLRVAAVHALAQLAPATVRPLRIALESDPDDGVKAAARALGKRQRYPAAAPSSDAIDTLPEHPDLARALIARSGASLPVGRLHQLIEEIRGREEAAGEAERQVWTTVRAAVHAALARRASRVALYDLRETLEQAKGPLPVDMITALALVGDPLALESIAAAYARSIAAGESKTDWWPRHLADAFRAIVKREKLTRRHAVLKKIGTRWTRAAADLLG
jgi:hypothetical protein